MFWKIVLYAAAMALICFLTGKVHKSLGNAAAIALSLAMCAAFGGILFYVGHSWWSCILPPFAALMFCVVMSWGIEEKAANRVAGYMVIAGAAVIVLAIVSGSVSGAAVKKDARLSALRDGLELYRGTVKLEGYAQDDELDLGDYPKPYIFYFVNASDYDENTGYIRSATPRFSKLFMTEAALSDVKTVVVALKYSTVGRVYEEYVNGVYTGDTTISNNDIDLMFFNVDEKCYYELDKIVNSGLDGYDKSAKSSTKYMAIRKLREIYSGAK